MNLFLLLLAHGTWCMLKHGMGSCWQSMSMLAASCGVTVFLKPPAMGSEVDQRVCDCHHFACASRLLTSHVVKQKCVMTMLCYTCMTDMHASCDQHVYEHQSLI